MRHKVYEISLLGHSYHFFLPKEKTIFPISKSYVTTRHDLSNDYIIKYMMTM